MIGLRVAHLVPSLNPTGATSSALNLARWLRDHGHASLVVTQGGTREQDLEETGASVIAYDSSKAGWLITGKRRLARAVADWQPDLLHVHRLDGLGLGLSLARKLALPVVASVHRAVSEDEAEPLRDAMVSVVLVPSESQRAWYCSRAGLDRNRVAVLPYGLDLGRFPPRAEIEAATEAATTGPITIGSIGKFDEDLEGMGQLIEAIATLRAEGADVRGLLVGSGHGRDELAAMLAKRDLDQVVELQPAAPRTAPILARMDIFVYPVSKDAHSLVLLKAMAAGCAVIASAVGGVPEVIHDGESGLLVPPGDAAALTGALRTLVSDHHLRAELGLQARATIEQEHDLDLVGRAAHELYRCALRGGPTGATGTETVNTWRRVTTGADRHGGAA